MATLKDEVKGRTGTTDGKYGGNSSLLPTQDIPLEQIREESNVRRDYKDIDELSANIRVYGLQQPVVVYPDSQGGYILIDGHRRYKAYRQLAEGEQEEPKRFQRIPCIVSDDKDIVIRQLVSNIQRSDLSQTEVYTALMTLKDQCTTDKIAVIMGKDEKTVKNLFAVVKKIAEDDYLKEYIAGNGTIQEITEVIAIRDEKKRNELLEQRKSGKLANRKALRDEAKRVKQGERRERRQGKTGEEEPTQNPAGGIETKTPKITVNSNPETLRIDLALIDRATFDRFLERLQELVNQSSKE